MSGLATREAFIDELTAWLNVLLASQGVTVNDTTRLFDEGLITSIRILEVIAWVERAIGRRITDRDIRMDNFASVRRIASVFATPSANAGG